MKILIAIDDSEFSQAAIDSVANRAWPEHTEFFILSVAQPLFTDLGGVVLDADKLYHQQLIDRQIEALKKNLPGYSVTGKISEGHPTEEIINTAKDWHADFIIMGSHRRQGIDHFVMGSVAENVVNQSPCSVEIIKLP